MFKTIKLTLTADLVRGQLKLELFQYALINAALFFVPFFLGHPQILIGSFVNAMLIYIAVNFKGYKLMPAVFLPALAVLSQGLIFGPLTKYLAIFIPFIWVSNFVLIFSIRAFLVNGNSKLKAFVSASFLKALFLFLIAVTFVTVFDFPKLFLIAMGPFQLITALIGAIPHLLVRIDIRENK